MVLIDSIYTHNSGGRTLLNNLVSKFENEDFDQYFLFDKRCQGAFQNIPVYKKQYIKPQIRKRYQFYSNYSNSFDKILCFSNVPPLIKTKATVYTFFQNLLLCHPSPYHSLYSKSILSLKKLFIQKNLPNTDYIIVQSSNVKEQFLESYNFKEKSVLILPFFDNNFVSLYENKDFTRFIFVSDGNPHKNHINLLIAWELINKVYPQLSLHLTVSPVYKELQNLIESYIERGVNIVNHQWLNKEQLAIEYKRAGYLVYPSVVESFGLGLIEAIQYGCEVIAAQQPYVEAVCKPLGMFNEAEPNSIANTVINIYKSGHFNMPQKSMLNIKDQIDDWIKLFI